MPAQDRIKPQTHPPHYAGRTRAPASPDPTSRRAIGAGLSLGDCERELVFTNAVGNALDLSNLTRSAFKPLLARAGVPVIRFHDLRPTAATLLLLSGIHPKVVSEMLGHSSITITLNLYSHVLPDMRAGAASAMEQLLQG